MGVAGDGGTNEEQLTRHEPGSHLGDRSGRCLMRTKMETKPLGPDEAFARDLESLDRDLELRERADNAAPTVDLIAGLVAGMRLVGRPQ